MKITMQFLDSVRPACRANSWDVVVDCKMTTSQMHDALLQFLEHISGTEWAQWVREIDSDSQEMVPCRHEFYQGTCAHCALPADEFRKSQRGTA